MSKIKIYLLCFFCILTIKIYAKEDSLKFWKLNSLFSLNGTQSSFINWNSGGRNNLSFIGFIWANANYSKNKLKWSNNLNLAIGATNYFDKSSSFQKTDDKIDFSSIAEYNISKHLYLSFLTGFKTQMLNGFAVPHDSVISSTFMAPGYLNMALGLDYIPNEKFSVFLSPISEKSTFVLDNYLSGICVFGVEKGKKTRMEYGAYAKLKFNKEVMKNIDLRSKLELFSNYLHNPQNIDVNAELALNFKINSIFSAMALWNLIYDDDIKILDSKGNLGPRTQFKSVLGLGISYKLEN